MNRRFGVPALAGSNRLKAGLINKWHPIIRFKVSMHAENESGLSMNWSFVLVVVLVLVLDWVPCLRGQGRAGGRSGSWSQCMRKKTKGALHEPEGRARQSPARRLCIAKLRRAWSDAPYPFKVPVHDRIDV